MQVFSTLCRFIVGALFLLTFSSIAVATEYASVLFPEKDGYDNMSLVDTADSGNLLLYRTSEFGVDGIPSEQYSYFDDLYLYDVSNNTHTQVSVGLNGTPSNSTSGSGVFVGTDKIYFNSRATNLVEELPSGSQFRLYSYDIASQEVSLIDNPVGLTHSISYFVASPNGAVVYGTFDRKIYKLDTETNEWSPTGQSTNNGNYLVDVSENGSLVFIDTSYRLSVLFSDLTIKVVEPEATAKITHDGSELVVLKEDYIRKYDLDSAELSYVEYQLPSSLVSSFNQYDFVISSDGNYAAIRGNLVSNYSNYSTQSGLFVIRLETGDIAQVDTFESQEFSGQQITPIIDIDGASLKFIQKDRHNNGVLASIDFTDSLFEYENPINNITIESNTPLTVSITGNSLGDRFAITRTRQIDGGKEHFISDSHDITDYKFGLTAGKYQYIVTLCNVNLVCDEASAVSTDIEVKDFTSSPSLTAKLNENVSTNTSAEIEFTSTKADGVEYVQFTDPAASNNQSYVNATRTSVISKSVRVYDGIDILMVARFCIRNHNGSYSCGKYGEPVTTEVPDFFSATDIQVKPRPDFSAMSVSWPEVEGLKYTLFRRVSNQDYEEIYSGSVNEFLDTDLPYGSYVNYRVKQCMGTFCFTADSRGINYDRFSSPIYVSGNENDDGSVLLRIRYNYAYDKLRISRRIINEQREFTFLAEIQPPESSFTYYSALDDNNYEYQVRGCTVSKCLHSDTTNVYTRTSLNVSALPVSPGKPSVSASHFMASTLTWRAVEGADGYRVTAVYQNSGLSEYTVVGGETTTFIDHFDSRFGESVKYSVQSFKYSSDNPEEIGFLSEPSSYRRHRSIKTALNTQMATKILKGSRIQGNGDIFLDWAGQNRRQAVSAGEYVRIFRKKAGEGAFTQVDLVENSSTYTATGNNRRDTNYQFKIKVCSYITRACSAYSNTIDFTTEEALEVPVVTAAPKFSWQNGTLLVEPQIPPSDAINKVEARLFNGDNNYSFVTLYTTSAESTLTYDGTSNITPASKLRASTRYCYPRSYYSDTCTDWSEEAELTLPVELSKVPSVAGISDLSVEESFGSASLSYQVTSNSPAIAAPTYLLTYLSTGRGELLQSQKIDNFTLINQRRYFDVTEENLALNKKVFVQAQLCNDSGCGERSQVKIVNTDDLDEEDVPIPSMPSIGDIIDSSRYDAAVVNIDSVPFATRYILRAELSGSATERNVYDTTFGYEFTSLQPLTEYSFRVKACNDEGCSEFSEEYKYVSQSLVKNVYALSGEATRNISSWNSSGAYWSLKNGAVSARYGELDTWHGNLSLNTWLDTSLGFQARSRVYLEQHDFNSCETLYSMQLELPSERSSSVSFKSDIFKVIYSGNGCTDYPDVELFKLFIASPYLSEPYVFEDANEHISRWLNIDFAFDQAGIFSMTFDGKPVEASTITLDQDLFALASIGSHVGNQSRSSAISLESNNLATDALFDVPNYQSVNIRGVHPRLLQVSREPELRTEYWQLEENVAGIKKTLEPVILEEEQSALDILTGMRPGTQYQWLVKQCRESVCSPARLYEHNTPQYGQINRANLYVRSFEFAGQIPLEVDLTVTGHADSFKLFMRENREGAETTQLFEKTYLEMVEELDNKPFEFFNYIVDGLEPESEYIFELEVCNPAGCHYEESTRVYKVPIDTDGDDIIDIRDAFPNDPSESEDTDGDGVGNNSDEDDDGDGISDAIELQLGLDPLKNYDLRLDMDNDGYRNITEYLAGSDIQDSESIPGLFNTYVSFESHESYRSIRVQDAVKHINGYRLHGEVHLSGPLSHMEQAHASVFFAGEANAGKVTFGYQGNRTLLKVYVDGNLVEVTESIYPRINDYYLLQFPVQQGYREIEFRLLKTDRDWWSSNIDGILIPTGIVGSNVRTDFNNDLRTDVLWRNSETGENRVWLMDDVYASETFELAKVADLSWKIAGQGDFNADGYTDLLWRNQVNGDNRVWSFKGGERVENNKLATVKDLKWEVASIGDFNGDQVDDILWRHAESGGNLIWTMKRGRLLRKQAISARYNTDWVIRGTTDLDYNGVEDILWQDTKTGATAYWLLDDTGVIKKNRLDAVEQTAWMMVAVEDFDGNGTSDIVWRNQETAETRIWYRKLEQEMSFEKIKTDSFRQLTWKIVATGDYNKDGLADLMWRNTSNGNNVIFFSTSTQGVMQRLQSSAEPETNFSVIH